MPIFFQVSRAKCPISGRQPSSGNGSFRPSTMNSPFRFYPDHARFKGGHEYASCDLYADPDETERVLMIRNFGVEIPSSRLETGLPAGFRNGEFIVDGRNEPFPEDGCLPEIGHFALLTWKKTKPI